MVEKADGHNFFLLFRVQGALKRRENTEKRGCPKIFKHYFSTYLALFHSIPDKHLFCNTQIGRFFEVF